MSLKAELKALRTRLESGRPAEVVATMHRAVEELRRSGAADKVLASGDTAPHFVLPSAAEQSVDSRALLARGPLVVTFYRGRWWPYCNVELVALQAILPELEALGASLVAISPQLPEHNRELARTRHLAFEILTDRGNEVAAQFGLRFGLPDYLRDVYRTFPLDLEKFNGDPSWTLPIPARFVIDEQGIIRSAQSDPDYTTRPEPEDTLEAVRAIARRRWAPSPDGQEDPMAEPFEYVSRARLEYRDGYRRAYLGEVPEPVVYGVQGALREYYGAKEGAPIASTLDHIVAAVAGWMYGTLRGALAGRKIAFDRDSYTAAVEGRITGVGKTIRITAIHVHYNLAVPGDAREATERALEVHPEGCPAHQSVKDAIAVTWSATLKAGDQVTTVRQGTH